MCACSQNKPNANPATINAKKGAAVDESLDKSSGSLVSVDNALNLSTNGELIFGINNTLLGVMVFAAFAFWSYRMLKSSFGGEDTGNYAGEGASGGEW